MASAWSSYQSNEMLDRSEFEKKIEYFTKKFEGTQITRPPFWSGYRVFPELIEFWQDMPFRLHDRLEFKKIDNKWKGRKLYP